MDKEQGHNTIDVLGRVHSHKEFIKNGETVDVGTFEDFLSVNPLKEIIRKYPECFDLPVVISSEIERFSNYNGVLKTEFTGSMARVALGFGTMERYYEGKKGMQELLTQFSDDDGDEEVNFIKGIVSSIVHGSLDMDFCFKLDGQKDLFDLYDMAMKDHSSLPGFSNKEKTVKLKNEKGEEKDYPVKEFTALIGGKYDTLTRLEPIPMRPDLMKMTMYVSMKNGEEKKELVHLDLTLFPKDGVQAERQGRSGGRTLRSQDKGRMEMRNIEGKLHLIKTPEAVSALNGSDEMDTKGKKITSIAELAMRASRIAQIGFPEKLDINMNSVNTLFHPKTVFAIRRRMEDFRLGLTDKHTSEKDFRAAIGDMILSFNYDPYATLQVLQDLQFSELSSLSGNEWKKLYLNKNMNLVAESDGFFVDPSKRSLVSVARDQKEYRSRKLTNGFVMVLKALNDINGSGKEFNFNESIKSFFFGEKLTLDRKELKGKDLKEIITSLLGVFNGGLTEAEMHNLSNTILGKELSIEEFRSSLFDIKREGKIDKRLEKIRIKNKDRTVTFYSQRNTDSKTSFYSIGQLIAREWKSNNPNPSINRAVEFYGKRLRNNDKNHNSLITGLQIMAGAGIMTLESLRSLSAVDFSDIYDKNKSNEISKAEFLIIARTLQIISEDSLSSRR